MLLSAVGAVRTQQLERRPVNLTYEEGKQTKKPPWYLPKAEMSCVYCLLVTHSNVLIKKKGI